jgi:hypothetical protein
MMPSAAIAAAMSLPVSAVATGSRTAFAALYRLCSRLKLLVSIQTEARRCEVLTAHLFGGSRGDKSLTRIRALTLSQMVAAA